MMARWADQEDEKNKRFPEYNNDKKGNSHNHFDKDQRNNSGNPRRRKSNQEVAVVERNPRGKKSRNNQAQFEKVLHKRYPIHPKSKHMLFECVSLRNPLPPRDGKRKDQGDGNKGDKSGAKTSKTRRTSLMSFSVEIAASSGSARRS
jgi:hypothetical protein